MPHFQTHPFGKLLAIPGPPNYPPPAFWWSARGIHPQKGDKNGQAPYHAIQLPTSKAFQDIPRWDSQVSVQSNPWAESTPGRCMPWRSWMCATLRMRLNGTGGWDEMGTIQAWILSSALPGSGGYHVFSSFFEGLFGLKWLKRTCPNLWNVLPPSPLRIRGWTQKSWGARAGDILGWPLSHLATIRQGSEKRSSTAERSFRAHQCGCSATWPLIICLLWLLWDGHQKLPSIQRDFHACFGSSMAGCDKWYASFVRLAESLIIQAKPMLLVRSRFLLQPRHETYLESPGLYYMIMERPLSSWMDNAIKGVK